MRKRVAVVITSTVVITLSGTAAALTLNTPLTNHSATNTTSSTTTSTTAPAQEAESIATTTTAPKPAGLPEEQVKAAQQKLNDLGYWVNTPDGKIGQSTQQAALAFQKLHDLKRTGALDSDTLAALETATRPTPASTSGDLIEVDKTHQVIYFVRGGQTLWVFNTSTGTEKNYNTDGNKGFAHTPTGTFKVLRTVDRVDDGPLGPLYRPRYFTNTGIAIHGAGSIPAYPASHGCARVSNAAMDYIWSNNLMPIGSLVWVYDDPAKQTFTPPTTSTTNTTAAPTTTTTVAPTTTTTGPATSTTLASTTSTTN